MVLKNKSGALQISFGWLFAIIVGAFILFLAIYGVTKLTKTESVSQSAETSKEIGILLNPLETSFEEAITTSISFPTETRIYNGCGGFGDFGAQRIRVEQKSFDKWVETDLEVEFQNKYIFSENPVEGEIFYLFSKPFEFPFKVNDLIYITSSQKNYCFSGEVPEDVEDEISDLNQPNLFVENCPEESVNVCFGGFGNCDVEVNYDSKSVEHKNSEKVYFESDALMYAAIFSEPDIYECQLERTLKRVGQLSQIYADKEILMSNVCEPSINPLLTNLKNSVDNFENSSQLYLSGDVAEDLEKSNSAGGDCKLW